MSRQQQAQVQQEQNAEQQEMKYMVQQDFLNVVGIAQDVQETINFYEDDPNHQMVQVQMNRLILQLNLSNTIHVDLSQRTNDKNSLTSQKSYVGQKLQTVMGNHQFDQRIVGYLNKYQKQNLCENPFLKQENSVEVQVKSKFDESVVQKVIGGMRKVDDDINEIKQGKKIQQLTDEQIEKFLEKRSQNAQTLLKQNKTKNNEGQNQKNKKNQEQNSSPNQRNKPNRKDTEEQPKKQQVRECKCVIQ